MDEMKEKSSELKHKNEDSNEEKYRNFASLAFMIVVILIGVPMWWKTTEVYRVNLPSVDILNLSEKSIKTAVQINIFTFKEELSRQLINELQQEFEQNDLWLLRFERIPHNEKAETAKTPASLETILLSSHTLNEGDFIFIEWPKLQEDILLSAERSAFMRTNITASKISNVLRTIILQNHRMRQILAQEQRYATKNEAPQVEYDIIVSVLNPRPDFMDAKWNVQMAVETYIAPLLQQVSVISNYTLKTQWKYQLPFEAELRQVRDSSTIGRHYALSESALPHIITSIEKKLGVGITAKSAINLVVYIPPCDIAPVHIYNRRNARATRNNIDSFISPKWGGVIIANPPSETCLSFNETPQRVQFFVNTNDVMQIMLYQLHKLLDINVEFKMDGVNSVELEQITPRRWEYDAYIRRSTIAYITTATNTLQSLIKLLDNISYIVINDNVGGAINEAYENICAAKSDLARNALLEASKHAKTAFIASEQAFFDVSLLAQLYFPDEQKYAIYIPLFLPIMVPVITSFSMIKKMLAKLLKREKLKTN